MMHVIPAIISIGQLLEALQSGEYDLNNTFSHVDPNWWWLSRYELVSRCCEKH